MRLRQITERIPAGRWGDPADFAGPIVFLASKASQYVCGEVLVVDGVSPLRLSLVSVHFLVLECVFFFLIFFILCVLNIFFFLSVDHLRVDFQECS